MRLPVGLRERVDVARGDVSVNRWLVRLVEQAVGLSESGRVDENSFVSRDGPKAPSAGAVSRTKPPDSLNSGRLDVHEVKPDFRPGTKL